MGEITKRPRGGELLMRPAPVAIQLIGVTCFRTARDIAKSTQAHRGGQRRLGEEPRLISRTEFDCPPSLIPQQPCTPDTWGTQLCGKEVTGRNCHLGIDLPSLMLSVAVNAANLHDSVGGEV